jgi:hypothetical protein
MNYILLIIAITVFMPIGIEFIRALITGEW